MRRTIGLVLILVCLGLGLFTGWQLKQAKDATAELQGQMKDFMAAEQGGGGAAALGVLSLSHELQEVQQAARRDEAGLGAEVLGVLVGVSLYRRRLMR